MIKKNFIPFLLAYLSIILSVPVFFNPVWLKDFPDMKIYDGEVKFSGEAAYDKLNMLIKNFPNRITGSENAEKSALWIEEEFRKLGLKTKMEEFECYTFKEKDGTKSKIIAGALSDHIKKVKGFNIIGVSEGRSKNTIVIGAHRDISGSIEGAEDNGSGTATLLELARVLQEKDHYYTYMFVSFDGEEIGLCGAEAFVKSNPNLPVKLALILDMTGYKEADTIGFYQYADGMGASPVWTMILAKNILDFQGLQGYYFNERYNKLTIEDLIRKTFRQRVTGYVNTDSGPFIDRNIPAIGIMAANHKESFTTAEGQMRKIHVPEDTIQQVSPQTMEMVGRFAERYIRSIGWEELNKSVKSHYYVIMQDKLLNPKAFQSFLFFVTAAFIYMMYLSFKSSGIDPKHFILFITCEKKCIASIFLLSVISGFFWLLLKIPFVMDIPVVFIILLWFLVNIIWIITVLILRLKSLKAYANRYGIITVQQRLLLNLFYVLMFFAYFTAFNPFVAICIMALPILLMARVGYRNISSRVIWLLIFAVWSIIHFRISLVCMQPYIFNLIRVKSAILISMNSLVWMFTFIYFVSTPPIYMAHKSRLPNSTHIDANGFL